MPYGRMVEAHVLREVKQYQWGAEYADDNIGSSY